jgi:hypothetical protein
VIEELSLKEGTHTSLRQPHRSFFLQFHYPSLIAFV